MEKNLLWKLNQESSYGRVASKPLLAKKLAVTILFATMFFGFGLVNSNGQDASITFPVTSFTTRTVNPGAYNQVDFINGGSSAFSSSSYTNCAGFTSGATMRIDGSAKYLEIVTPNSTLNRIEIRIQANSTTAAKAIVGFSTNGTSWNNFVELDLPPTNANPSCFLHNVIAPAGAKYFRMMRVVFGGYTTSSTTGQTIRIFNANVYVNTACTAPATQASGLSFANITTTSMDVNFTRGDGDGGVLVVARSGAAPSGDPVSGTSYTADANYLGAGSAVGGGKVVYSSNTPATGPVSFTMTGLQAGTTYHFAIYEYNTTGTCYRTTDELIGQQAAAASVATVTTNAVTNVTQNSATSGGNVTSENGAAVTERGVVYSTSPNPTTTDAKVMDALGGPGAFTSDLVGLTSITTYYVRAYAINSEGTAYGNEVSFTTAAPPTPYRSKQNGNWNDPVTWEIFNGTTWVDAIGTPSSPDDAITILNGDTVTVTANVTVDEVTIDAGGQVSVNSGIVFTIANGAGTDITVNGTLKNTGTVTQNSSAMTVGATGIYEDAQPATTGTITIPTATWTDGSTFSLTGLVGATGADYANLFGVKQSFSNFIINTPGMLGKLLLTRQGLTTAPFMDVRGVLQVDATGSGTGVQILSSGNNNNTLVVGQYVQNGGNVQALHNASGAANRSFTVQGNFTLNNNAVFDVANTTGTNAANITNVNIGGDLFVASTATLQRTNQTNVTGTLVALVFNGTGAQTVTMNGTFNSTYLNTVVNKASGTLTLNSGLAIRGTGTLTLTAGITDFSNQNVIFRSEATGTARLGQVTGTLTGATNVTVERFVGIPAAKRAWRLLTTPLRGDVNNSVHYNWQSNGAATVGAGTLITGPNADPAINGLDVTSGNSLKAFDGTNLVGVDNTKSALLMTNTAGTAAGNNSYFIFVRGDRSSLTDLGNVSQTTLKATGTLQSGDQVFATNVTNDGFTLIGNPYASQIDFDAFRQQNATANIKPNLYFWDANATGANGVGAYGIASWDGTEYDYTGAATVNTTIIPSSAAFFVQTLTDQTGTTPAVTFSETQKTAAAANHLLRVGTQTEKLNIKLLAEGANAVINTLDGTLARFNNNYSSAVGNEDAGKLMNMGENISLARNGSSLVIEGRPLVDNQDTLFLQLNNMKVGTNYQFELSASNFNAPALEAIMVDRFTATTSPLSLSGSTTTNFTVTSDAASTGDRFIIVFREVGTLPVNFTNVKAYQQNNGIQVEWNVAAESNIRTYEVEKSVDGRTFTPATSVTAKANNNGAVSYAWFDANAVNGNNFYRIKANDKAGTAKLSAVVNVRLGKSASITVYPNPVKNNVVSLQFENQPKGLYTARVFNNLGQVVFTKTIQHAGGSSTQTIALDGGLTKGVYQMQVTNGEENFMLQIICN